MFIHIYPIAPAPVIFLALGIAFEIVGLVSLFIFLVLTLVVLGLQSLWIVATAIMLILGAGKESNSFNLSVRQA